MSKGEQFKLYKGFFQNKATTLHENWKALFILMPEGEFMKYDGEDYYTAVKDFFE